MRKAFSVARGVAVRGGSTSASRNLAENRFYKGSRKLEVHQPSNGLAETCKTVLHRIAPLFRKIGSPAVHA